MRAVRQEPAGRTGWPALKPIQADEMPDPGGCKKAPVSSNLRGCSIAGHQVDQCVEAAAPEPQPQIQHLKWTRDPFQPRGGELVEFELVNQARSPEQVGGDYEP